MAHRSPSEDMSKTCFSQEAITKKKCLRHRVKWKEYGWAHQHAYDEEPLKEQARANKVIFFLQQHRKVCEGNLSKVGDFKA